MQELNLYDVMMQSQIGMCILKGEDNNVVFANDLYLKLFNKSKDMIGKPFFKSFPELINQGIREIIEGVVADGSPFIINDQAIILREKDTIKQRYFNSIYQPLREHNGMVSGASILCSEVTDQIIAQKIDSEYQKKTVNELDKLKKELSFEKDEKQKRATELSVANIELAYQKDEKQKRARELVIANEKLAYQNDEKEKRASELVIANEELAFQNDEKEKRASELIIANEELAFQNDEKEKRASELVIANVELAYQNEEKEKRATELGIANVELAYQNDEKEKRASELGIANVELAFQNAEKKKRAMELGIANVELAYQGAEKKKRAAELGIANVELAFQGAEKKKRAAELGIANVELAFQDAEKKKRAVELGIANVELSFQNDEKEKRVIEHKALEITSSFSKIDSQYVRSLIEAGLDPLIIINNKGKIMDMNTAFTRAVGQTYDELTHTNFVDHFLEPREAEQCYLEIFQKGFVANFFSVLKDHKLTPVLLNGSVYKDENGNIPGAVILAKDITERVKVEKELNEARIYAELAATLAKEATMKAEDAVKSKQQFLSNMSHEIRTPMNAIIGFTKVVLKTELTAKQKEYLMAIKLSGDALIVLINDILDLAKVDAGKMTFEKTPFKLALSVSAMIYLFETKIQEKNLRLIKEYDNKIPEVLSGDAVRLHQIISNLLSNAVKFTSSGSITVKVVLLKEDEKSVTIEFSVADTGIGITADKLDTIFENFQQASSDTARLFGGTGLGLSIVKQLVEPQGGTINVVSESGVGSKFTFVLSFDKTDEPAVIESEIIRIEKENKNIKVLVVEDMILNQLLMKTVLDDFGFERDIADNGKIAIEKLKNKTYDLILMDLQMPVMNGFETTEYIRNTLKSKIPIIALTADVTTVDLAKCKAVGMDDYIAKPVDERLLYNKIIGLVKKTATARETKSDKIETKMKYTNMDYLLQRTKSDPALMMEMIQAYLDQTPPLISIMKKSYQDKDWETLHAAVHKMIPSFSIMGMSADYESMAKKVLEFSKMQEETETISDFVSKLELVCTQAVQELTEEFHTIKNTKK